MARWLAHWPFTSKVAGSGLTENFLNGADPALVDKAKVEVQESRKFVQCALLGGTEE